MSRDAAVARDLVRNRDGCCILCGKPVWMPITDCLAVGEVPAGILPCSRSPGWSGCAVRAIVGGEPPLWPTGLVCVVRHGVTPCSEVPVFRHGRWVLLDDNGGVVPIQRRTARALRSRHESDGRVAIFCGG